MTTAYVLFLRQASLQRNSQLSRPLSVAFSKYVFAILTVTAVREKIQATVHKIIYFYLQRN